MTEPASQVQELEALRQELHQRNRYVHELHLARERDSREMRNARLDLEDFVRWLREAEDERDRLKGRVEALEGRKKPSLAARLRSLGEKPKKTVLPPPPAEIPGAPFVYHLPESPYRVYREPTFTLKGWAFPQDGRAVTGLRARVDEKVFFGTYGIDEPAVIERYGAQPENPRPGFKIVIDTPPGRHRLSLEALLGGDGWFSILTLPIWVKPE